MKNIYLVTGAAGHLGLTVTQMLLARGEKVRALVLPSDTHVSQLPDGAQVMTGDVRDTATLERCFATGENEMLTVIHCAGIVTIATRVESQEQVQALASLFVDGYQGFISPPHPL